MIRITSKRNGFRRCGMPHYREPVMYPDDRFTKEELEILKGEPMLTIEPVKKVELEIKIDDPAKEKEGLLEAAKKAIEVGKVTRSGKPTVEAIEAILGRDITAKERDEAYEQLIAED